MTNPRQLKYLDAMGIPVWVSRELVVEEVLKVVQEKDEAPCADSVTSILNSLDGKDSKPAPEKVPSKTADSSQSNKAVTADNHSSVPNQVNCADMDWQTLQQAVINCQLCDLHKTRAQTVFGSGNQQANWMIVGEAPGAEEDRQGQPFVGRAGQLLTNMLMAIGLAREEVYIANTLKCRPPNNRDPKPEEAASCKTYLQRQLQLINPKILLVVGRVAAQNLLQTSEPLVRLRGKVHQLPGNDIPVVVTYHPAYLLRKPSDKSKAWEDLKLAINTMKSNAERV